jgi:zinc transport system substrate-binding protein
MEGLGTPAVIVHGPASPHSYSLRPSEAREISGATVVFWLGPEYETFLTRPLATLAHKAKIVALLRAPDVHTLAARRGGSWEAATHTRGTISSDLDPHAFLDPRNAIAMTRAMALALEDTDPEHRNRYAANAERAIALLTGLDLELDASLAGVRDVPFLVFHDGYQYLEHRYGLHAVGSIVVTPERPPGAKRLTELRRKVVELKAACVFGEPQFEPALVKTAVEGTKAKTGVLDYIGVNLTPGPDAYFKMMRDLARNLVDCLSG